MTTDTEVKTGTDKIETFKEADKPFENLPRAEDPTYAYNKANKTFWVGIPVEKCDPLVAFAILDSMKLNYLQVFQIMQYEKKNSIVLPSTLNRARDFFLRKTGKA